MEDIFLGDDSLLDELENKFHGNNKQDTIDDPFDIEINYEDNDLYKNLVDKESLNITTDDNHEIKKGRPKGSLKKISREKIVDKKITISLSLEEKEALEKKAKEDDRSISSFIE